MGNIVDEFSIQIVIVNIKFCLIRKLNGNMQNNSETFSENEELFIC